MWVPPRSTSRSAPAGCRPSSPARRSRRRKSSYTPDEIAALAAYVASLGPGPAIPNPADYSLDGLSEEERQEAIARGGQIFLTNCTACHNFEGSGGAMPHGGYAPKIRGVDAKYIFEAMLTGPQAMDNFSNGNLSVEEKRDIIAYLQSLEDNPGYGGFGLGGIGPVSEGLFAWLVGIGSLVGVAIWIAAHTARTSKTKAELMNDNLPETTARRPHARRGRRADPQPRVSSRTSGVPTDVDPKAEKRAERQVAGLFGLAIVGAVLFVVCYFVFQVGDNPDTIGNLGASNVALGLCPGRDAAGHGRRHDPVGPQADGRPRDRRDAPPRLVLAGGPRGRPSASSRPGSRSPGSAAAR